MFFCLFQASIGIMFLGLLVCLSVRSFICYQTCEHNVLKMKTSFDANRQRLSMRQWHETLNFLDREVKVQGHLRPK